MSNVPIKPIKVLAKLTAKKEVNAKSGLIVSGTIDDAALCDPNDKVGLKVNENVYFDKDLYVADKTFAVGFSQVGVLDVNGLLQVSGHLVTTGSFELSGANNFDSIPQVTRSTEGLYFVDNAIYALDQRIFSTKNKLNKDKYAFTITPTTTEIIENNSDFLWSDAGYISITSMIYNPASSGNPESWSNDLVSIRMQKYTDSGGIEKIKFVVVAPKTTDPGFINGTFIRVVASRQTDIQF